MEILGTHTVEDVVNALVTAHGARVIVCSATSGPRFLDATTGETVLALEPRERVLSTALEGERLVLRRFADDAVETPVDVALWDVRTLARLVPLTAKAPRPIAHEVGRDRIYTLSGDGTLETTHFDGRYEHRAGATVVRVDGVIMAAHVLAPDERWFAFGSAWGTAWIYDLETMCVQPLPGAPVGVSPRPHRARVLLDRAAAHVAVHARDENLLRVWSAADRSLVEGPWSDRPVRDAWLVGDRVAWITGDDAFTREIASARPSRTHRVTEGTRLVRIDDARIALVSPDTLTVLDVERDVVTGSLALPEAVRTPTVVTGGAGHVVIGRERSITVVRA